MNDRFAALFTAGPLELELGGALGPVEVAYRTYGTLNRAGDNAVLVCHALTGSAAVDEWWPGALGPGRMLDPERDFVVCSNVLGGCSGSTGPTSPGPGGDTYGPDFPEVTVTDMVRLQAALLEHLGVAHVRAVIGGSMGGMQVLEWLRAYRERVGAGVAIGTPAHHSAWALAWGHLARTAVVNDPAYNGGRYAEQPAGLGLARGISMLSYRSPWSLGWSQGRRSSPRDPERFAVQTYLEHQGQKLVGRFDANSYLTISRAMDRFDLPPEALAEIRQPVLCVGISSDLLYTPGEVRALADALPGGEYWELASPHGHDAFLIDVEPLSRRVRAFLDRVGSTTGAPVLAKAAGQG